jgi:GAF domain-containing protein
MSLVNADIARSLAESARAINAPQTLDDTLDAIVRSTLASVPGFDHVGISILHRDGRIETKAGTDQVVWELDDLQYRIDEGPCVSAIRGNEVVSVPDIRHEQRWPRYVPDAVLRTGLQAQLAVHLHMNGRTIGGLNLYSTSSPAIDHDAPQAAELFATHAALALARARRESDLNEAIVTRQEIGMAIGLTMARFNIDHERAFQYLVRASSSSQIKVRDIAREIIREADARYREPTREGRGAPSMD